MNELTGVNDAKRAATGVDPITGEELTAGQRVAAGGMAAAGYIPIVGWAGRIFKGGKAVYKTTQATSAAVRAVDIYKTSQKSFDALKTSKKRLIWSHRHQRFQRSDHRPRHVWKQDLKRTAGSKYERGSGDAFCRLGRKGFMVRWELRVLLKMEIMVQCGEI
ncbi:hypothetical protein BsIDN1_08650 [Bacillus safensis]|uniref:Pre-toxin TG domain-containing protein n=1 Tax=Bacillus safensis TaxID=561879 RepID=A0A5S9M0W5_BACIA|nr:hypothetical protein BsIDN1_08650 [Bacillus safensis]